MEYLDFGGELRERLRWWKDVIIGMALSKDKTLEGDRKSRLPNVGCERIQASWVALFCNIVE